MNCFNCQAIVQAADLFCEECGTALAPPMPTPPIAVTGGCQKCGATADRIDADGYCLTCGFRNPVPQDHFEIVQSPHLAGVSDRGLKHHQNEDFLAIATVEIANQPVPILIVCDGVSSSQQPQLASQAAATTTCNSLSLDLQANLTPELALTRAIATASTAVCQIPTSRATETDPPSTTIVAAVVCDQIATIGWLGDSRAYWVSVNGSRQLTRDDSWVNQAVAQGELTAAEAERSPHAHAITRWLGADAKDDVTPSLTTFAIPGAGYFLLCSDGLWNYLPHDEQWTDLLRTWGSVNALTLSQKLVEFALAQGGHDNITVAILQIT